MDTAPGQGLQAHIVKKLHFFSISITMRCKPGQTLILTGPSGSGKTTVLRCLAGLERLDAGFIRCNGDCWDRGTSGPHTKARFRNIGFLTQDYGLFPHMTVYENIRFAMRGPEDPEACLAAMGIWHLRQKRPHEISGGERQRAALCQSLASRPQMLLLDEPFSALDIDNRTLLHNCLAKAQEESGLMILHVTHDLSEILNNKAQVIALNQGQEAPEWLARQQADLTQRLRQWRGHQPPARNPLLSLKHMEEDVC